MRTAIVNASIVTPNGIVTDRALMIDGEKIEGFATGIDGCKRMDAGGGYVLPGFVDMHVHGGGGFDFMDGTKEAFDTIVRTHLSHGTTALAPTTVACAFDDLYRLIALYQTRNQKNTATRLLGLHLEGPFISAAMKGAQPERYIVTPTKTCIQELFERGGDSISRISGAPEIDGMTELAGMAKARGITLSIGHSNATAPEVERAYQAGFTHITHLYSNTPTIHKVGQTVYAGIVEAAYLNDNITIELIGDGKHVPKEAMQLAVKIKGAQKVSLITDAMRAAGTDCTESYLGAQEPQNRVIIEDGVAKLPDRTFYAGSIATADMLFRNAVIQYGLPICTVSQMMSLAPAKVLGREKEIGTIEAGKYADLVVMDSALHITDVFVGGEKQV